MRCNCREVACWKRLGDKVFNSRLSHQSTVGHVSRTHLNRRRVIDEYTLHPNPRCHTPELCSSTKLDSGTSASSEGPLRREVVGGDGPFPSELFGSFSSGTPVSSPERSRRMTHDQTRDSRCGLQRVSGRRRVGGDFSGGSKGRTRCPLLESISRNSTWRSTGFIYAHHRDDVTRTISNTY